MTRKPTWLPDLFSYVESVWHTPFEWGTFDCFIFAGGAVKAMTGNAYVDQIVGKYSDQESATALSKAHGFASPMAFIAKEFTPHPSILDARRGDLMIIRGEASDLLLGICQGERIYVAGPDGMATVPLLAAKRSFMV